MEKTNNLGTIPVVERMKTCESPHYEAGPLYVLSRERIGDTMSVILWLLGIPVTLALVMWLVEIVKF